MFKSKGFRLKYLLLYMLLSACASVPADKNDICSVLIQKNGLLVNWEKASKSAAMTHKIDLELILATIFIESSFNSYAKPQRTKVLGFIPWKRLSSAYGYAQALDSSWKDYIKDTGRIYADRHNFYDATDFIAWYYRKSIDRHNIKPKDYKSLYITYHLGNNSPTHLRKNIPEHIMKTAQRLDNLTKNYSSQLYKCGIL
ncbi:hypothetical protein [Bartonella sp. DGB1]|uniref:transglycosylase SLT domain-containing protein n=1 Tax=Bartonella sp. DGB1 TaxID=3239807 RepID=UPI00352398C2